MKIMEYAEDHSMTFVINTHLQTVECYVNRLLLAQSRIGFKEISEIPRAITEAFVKTLNRYEQVV